MPVGCLFPAASFYTILLFKTISPVVVVALFWSYAAFKHTTTRNDAADATRFAAQYSLLVLELVVSSVSTTIVRTYSCSEFDDGWYLAVDLTLACDASPKRRFLQFYAGCMILAYPIGELFA